MIMKILLPFVDATNDPLILAEEVSRTHSKNAEVVALYIVDMNLIKRARSYSESISPDKIEEVLIASAKGEGQTYLDRLKKEFEKKGLIVKTCVRVGNVVDEVIKEAKKLKVDMISLVSTENIDVVQLSKVAPLMVTALKFEKKSLPRKDLMIIAGLGIASIVWYKFIFTDLDFINRFVMAGRYYSGIMVWGILLATVLIYGTFVGKVLKFIGLDTKSAH